MPCRTKPDLPTDQRTRRALGVAVRHSRLKQRDVATAAGLTLRTLQRILSGNTEVSLHQRDQIFAACALKPTTCALSGELGYDHLIGSPFQDYVDRFVPLLFELLDQLRDEQTLPIDPRWAAMEAQFLHQRWQTMIRRREETLNGLNEGLELHV